MKRCPYCAEDIRNEAIICRHCGRRVKKSHLRLIVVMIVISALAIFAATHKTETREIIYKVKTFFVDAKNNLCALKDAIIELPRGVESIKELRQVKEGAGIPAQDAVVKKDEEASKDETPEQVQYIKAGEYEAPSEIKS